MVHKKEIPEFVGQLIDSCEDYIVDRGIDVNGVDAKGVGADEEPVIIAGADYNELETALKSVLYGWDVLETGNPEQPDEPLILSRESRMMLLNGLAGSFAKFLGRHGITIEKEDVFYVRLKDSMNAVLIAWKVVEEAV